MRPGVGEIGAHRAPQLGTRQPAGRSATMEHWPLPRRLEVPSPASASESPRGAQGMPAAWGQGGIWRSVEGMRGVALLEERS